MTVVPITSPDLAASEVSWFAALCSDDYRFLGVPEGELDATRFLERAHASERQVQVCHRATRICGRGSSPGWRERWAPECSPR